MSRYGSGRLRTEAAEMRHFPALAIRSLFQHLQVPTFRIYPTISHGLGGYASLAKRMVPLVTDICTSCCKRPKCIFAASAWPSCILVDGLEARLQIRHGVCKVEIVCGQFWTARLTITHSGPRRRKLYKFVNFH
jgi:hypothetical protein